jgi:K+-transporting ATPase c subunit
MTGKMILENCKLLHVFPFQSNGNVVNLDRKAAGSIFIAQEFSSPKFFHPGPASDSASSFAGRVR